MRRRIGINLVAFVGWFGWAASMTVAAVFSLVAACVIKVIAWTCGVDDAGMACAAASIRRNTEGPWR
jgi:hypothetical protein